MSDLAFRLEGDGSQTHIIASRQSYNEPKAVLPQEETIQGVHVHRVWSTRFGRYKNYGRVIDYLSFYVTSMFCLLRLTKRDDIVVAKTDPPLISVPAAVVTKLKSAHLVNWLQDLFPEVAEKLGVKFISGPLYSPLKRARNWGLHLARQNVAIGEKMAEYLRSEGIPDEKITIIDNWVDGEQIKPVAPDKNALRKEWGLEGKFVVGYSGNLGRAHDFSTILNAAKMLVDSSEIVFLFIGGGVKMEFVKKECRENGLNNVMFKPYQPRERLSDSLSVPDVHLISLNPALEGLIVPSKYYGVMAVARTVMFIGDDKGEIALKLVKNQCGVTIKEGDAVGLVSAIKKLSSNKGDCERMTETFGEQCVGVDGLKESIMKWKMMFQREFDLDFIFEQ